MENYKQRIDIIKVDNGFIVTNNSHYSSIEQSFEELTYYMQNTADYILDKNVSNEKIAESIRTKLQDLRKQSKRDSTLICNNIEEVKRAIDLLLKE